MLHYETYVMPEPEENKELFLENLLYRNRKLVGAAFCIGEEDAIFITGAIPASTVDETELDRILTKGGILNIKVPHFTRGFTHWDHKHGFDVTFPIYFDKDSSGGFNKVELKHVSTNLKWFAQHDLKKKHLFYSLKQF